VIWVLLLTVNEVAATPPKSTAVAPVKPVPLMVTLVPPPTGPELGLTPLTTGGATKVYWSADEVVEVPLGVVTVIFTVPADSAGAQAKIDPSSFTTKFVAATLPNHTWLAPVKPLPSTVTGLPPAVDPVAGLTSVTAGAAAAS
jgi:hypothetical protein